MAESNPEVPRVPGGEGGQTPPEKPRTPKLDAPPLYELADDVCPACGAALAPDAVVCVQCGFDLGANERISPETGEVEVAAEGAEPDGEDGVFVTPGMGSAKVVAVIGAAISLLALVAAGADAPADKLTLVAAAVFLSAYRIVLHTGTGIMAVFIAARLSEEKFGSLELGAARMFAAFSVFELVRHIPINVPAVGQLLAWLLAAGLYWLAVWVLFRKTPAVTLLIMIAHVLLWAVVELGMAVSEYLGSAVASAA